MSTMESARALLSTLPPVDYAAAYGSGVMKQAGYSAAEKPAIDVLLAVEDVRAFHDANMVKHPEHYSCLRHVGSASIAFTNNLGPGLYFHTRVFINGQEFKYGVVSIEKLYQDLCYWKWNYAAGRLQKPVVVLKSHPRVSIGQSLNYQNAIVAARLLLPNTFTERELIHQICALSYTGDVRMRVAENPDKVQNIVAGQEGQLRDIYLPLLDDLESRVPFGPTLSRQENGSFLQAPNSHAHLVTLLPLSIRSRMHGSIGYNEKLQTLARRWTHAVEHPDLESGAVNFTQPLALHCEKIGRSATAQLLHRQLKRIVVRGSLAQTAKGLLTTGLFKSLLYAGRKVGKRFR